MAGYNLQKGSLIIETAFFVYLQLSIAFGWQEFLAEIHQPAGHIH